MRCSRSSAAIRGTASRDAVGTLGSPFDGVEVGHRHGAAVFENLEIVLGQAGDRIPLLIGDKDLHVDNIDLDRLEERLFLDSSTLR
jgi:hypothetical protein